MNRLVASRLAERFHVERRLGEGAMGIVYEVVDRASGEHLAVKVLRAFDADAQVRFKREFRALRDVQHPNLVRLHELEGDDDLLFFTMDLVIGSDLLAYLRADRDAAASGDEIDVNDATLEVTAGAAIPGPVVRMRGPTAYDEARLRSTLVQLTAALATVHSHGFVHRDVKPSNIVVTSSGELKLLDFGLVTDPQSHRPSARLVVGTAAYMSPEQSMAQIVGPEADWYSVGVVLFEALTGQLPFVGNASEMIVKKQLFDAPPPRALVADVPADLDELCTRLMLRDPRARPGAEQIASALGAPLAARVSDLPRSALRQRFPLFVGRRAELDQLRQRLHQVASERRARAVTLLGISGVGKSALVSRFIQQARDEVGSLLTLEGRCYDSESVHYKGIDGVVADLTAFLRTRPHDEVASLVPRHAAALLWLLPAFSAVDQLARAPVVPRPSDPHAARTQAVLALRELFLRLTDRYRVIVSIDDVQWIDSDGRALIDDLLRGDDAPPLLLLATRLGPAEDRDAGYPNETLVVGPLAADDTRSLAVDYVAREGLDPATIDSEALAADAEGHPIFLFELVRHASLHERTPDGEPPRLEDALWERISGLEAGDRELLEAVCIAGGPVEIRAAAIVTGVSATSARACAARLRAASLCSTSGVGAESSLQPFHERVRSTVMAHVETGQTRSASGKFARALEATAPQQSEAIAMHWLRAEEPARAAPHAALAARGAAATFAFDRAAALLRVALLGTHERAAQQPLLVALGEALANGARGAEAARAFLDAASASASSDEIFDLRRRAADQLLRSGHVDEGLAAVREMLAEVSLRTPSSPRGALAMLLYHRARVALRGLGYQRRPESEIAPLTLRRIDVCWSIGTGLALVDLIRAADFQTRSLLMSLEAGEPGRISRALAMEAAFVSSEGASGRVRAKSLLDASARLIADSERPEAAAWLLLVRAICATQEGKYEDTYRFASEAEVLFRYRCTGTGWELASARAFVLWSMVWLGRLPELASRLPDLVRNSRERRDRFGTLLLTVGPVHILDLARDDTASLREACTEGLASWSQSGFHFQHMCALFSRTAADLYDSDTDAAVQAVETSWRAVERSLLLRVQYFRIDLWALRARVALSAALATRKPPSRLLATVKTGLKYVEHERMGWSAGHALGLRAGLAVVAGEPVEAAALLGRAATAFDAAAMRMHAACARLQRARLTDDDALASDATTFLEGLGVVRVERFSNAMVPSARAR